MADVSGRSGRAEDKLPINGDISDEQNTTLKPRRGHRKRNDTEQTTVSDLEDSDVITREPENWTPPRFQIGVDEESCASDETDYYKKDSAVKSSGEAGCDPEEISDEYAERGNWTGKFDFLLSLLGYSVGLGNVWRFPYLAYNNGGGAFVIPFLVMLLLVGFPLMFMELAFGQYASLGPIAIFDRFCPLFHGVGCGMIIVSSMVALYYNMIIAWTCFYMFASFTTELPWERCHLEWSTYECYSYKDAISCLQQNGSLYFNRTCFNETMVEKYNISELVKTMTRKPPAEEYFENYVLNMSNGMENMGHVKWQLALCLLLAWIVVFLCLSKGVQSSGKVVYFTALFPYLVLIILFFRGVTLPGATEGIIYYLTPNFSRLQTSKVWSEAAVQIFFSLSPAWGGLITLASYNKFHNNCYKDALIVSISNISTSIFAGLVIFSIVGYLAQELGKHVGDVVDEGAGLAFIVYPEVVTRLPVSPLWSFMFFLMLLTLGLDSQFALMETVTTATLDRFPSLREKKTWVVLGMSIIGYGGGITFCFQGGYYVLQLLDTYASSWSVFLLAILECIVIAWIYGAPRFLRDVEVMIGWRSTVWRLFFRAFWKFLSPATLMFLLIFNWVQYRPMTLGSYVYPPWANLIGWIVAFAPVIAVPLVMVYKICTAPSELSFIKKITFLLNPTSDWGPAHKVSELNLDSTPLKNQPGYGDRRYDLNPVYASDAAYTTTVNSNPPQQQQQQQQQEQQREQQLQQEEPPPTATTVQVIGTSGSTVVNNTDAMVVTCTNSARRDLPPDHGIAEGSHDNTITIMINDGE